MSEHHWIAVLDFGSQYSQLIARRIREQQVFSELVPHGITAAALRDRRPAGIILSGGPSSVFDPGAPTCDPALFDLGVPVLGICYGMQLTAQILGGQVRAGTRREYGRALVGVIAADPLFTDLPPELEVWMSHGDQVVERPPGFEALAQTPTCPAAAMGNALRRIYGLQFHPEADRAVLEGWMGDDADQLVAAGIDPEPLLAEADRQRPDARRRAERLLDWFCDATSGCAP